MDDPVYSISNMQDMLCNFYNNWEKDIKILYLERKLALLVNQLKKQEKLAENQRKLLNANLARNQAGMAVIKKKNIKLAKLKNALEAAKKELEARVEKRTKELNKKNQELQIKSRKLKESNIALDILLKKKDSDAQNLLQASLSEFRDQIIPELHELADLVQDKKRKTLVFRIMKRLQDFDFIQSDNTWSTCLSGREAAVADLIAQGKTHAQVAKALGVSSRTVNAHCYRIRKKLTVPSNTRLKDFLEAISRVN